MEKPLADDAAAPRPFGENQVEHQIIGVDVQQQVGQDGIIVATLALVFIEVTKRKSARSPCDRHAATACDVHESAQEGTLDQVVFGAGVVGVFIQQRMDGGTVIAFVE